jgi:catechol 2,3-dioxygenase-like lactoylglutathione lyase family enzyme
MPVMKIRSITVADPTDAWSEAGFRLDGDTCRVGTIDIRLAGRDAGKGLVEWELEGARSAELDGLRTSVVAAAAEGASAEAQPAAEERAPAETHPNGVVRIDHVVAFTPDRARTVEALENAGLDLRRLRDEPTPAGGGFQAFFRLGEAILEVIEAPPGSPVPPDAPARLWGLAFLVDDLDETQELLGDLVSTPRDAVQPGRRIATLRKEAGLSFGCAFMS